MRKLRIPLIILPAVFCGADPSSLQDVSYDASKQRNMRHASGVRNHHRLHTPKSEGTAKSNRYMLVTLQSAVVKGGEQLLKNAAGLQTVSEQNGKFPSWVCGVVLTLFSSTLTSLGLVLQKYSHIQDTRKESSSGKYYLQGWWVTGFAIWIFAQVVNLGAMGLAPQAVLSCLGSWTIICNIVIARVVLTEQVGCTEVMAMVGLLSGCALVLVGAPHEMAPHVSGEVHTIWTLLISRESLALTMVLGFATVALKTVLSGAVYWVFIAAVLTGFTAVLFKCVSLMLVASPAGMPSPWVCSQAYAIVFFAVVCGVLEIHTLNLALRLGKAVVLTPIYLSTGMLSQILTSGVLLHEFGQVSGEQFVIFFLGVSISIGFIAMLTTVRARTDDQKT